MTPRAVSWVAVACCVAAVGCADRRSPAPPPPSPALVAPTPHRYDPTTVETVRGEIARIDRVAETRGVHAVLAVEGGGSLSVRLGAAWYLDEQGLTLARGDTITVTGSRVLRDGAPALIAREVTLGERRVVLRTAGGVPHWSAARRRGEGPPASPWWARGGPVAPTAAGWNPSGMGSPGSLVAPLAEGPLDVVGDVHGELGVLRALLAQLGYDVRGGHPAGRRLVFVGDLCDRGVDSPGVVELVADLVARGRAQCILGNHELNLLREDSKTGNRWLIDPAHPEMADEFAHSRAATPAQAAACRAFLHGLPLALERPDLRVVHAAWHAPAIAELRAWPDAAIACFAHHEARVHDELDACGLRAAAEAERRAHHAALEDRHARPPLLAALGRFDEARQMRNPVRVATSGPERATTAPFWANGKWRMSDRVTWWDAYAEDVPVVVGHYWRLVEPAPAEGEVPTPGREAAAQELSGGKPPLFAAPAHAWVGARANVFCVDFSIGGRYRERRAHRDRGAATPPPYRTRLAAVRWPEQQLVFDDGVTLPLTR